MGKLKYEEAARIGKACGLDQPAEFVNNIFLHVLNIFPYEKMAEEHDELLEDAKKHGVKFSRACGDAILEEDSEDDPCYFCRKIGELK